MKVKDKSALKDWEEFKLTIERATAIDPDETDHNKAARKARLQKNIEEFAKYYFPHYCNSEFANFHKNFFKKTIESRRLYITRAWARDHAKSVSAGVILPLYLKFTGELKNMLLVSYSADNAMELLMPLQSELESNQRLISDYGLQKGSGRWEAGNFKTGDNCSFRSIGTGQSPRGSRNKEARPDFILCDDIDEDELCRNPRRLDQAWDWMTGALYGCFSITGKKRFIVVGNIIAKDSLVVRASKQADDHEQIDIYDKRDQPSWKERFTKEECAYMISKMGYRLSQREYFNNPISEGKVFLKKWFVFKKLPPLNSYRHLVAYLDPGFKKTATSDSKCLVLVGLHQGEFHIRKVWCDKASVEQMIDWCYQCDKFVKSKSAAYRLKMEEVFLQSLLYKDFSEAAKTKKYSIPVSGDTRKKPDKDARIEATSGHFERGQVYFDFEIEKDHGTQTLIEQYLNFEPGVRTLKDGPDAVEGAFHILEQTIINNSSNLLIAKRPQSKYKL